MMKMVSAFLAAPVPTRFGAFPPTWSRQSLLLVSTALTVILFIMDSALAPQDWSFSAGSEFVFYLVGLCTAWVYLKFGGGFRKPSKKNAKGKQWDATRASSNFNAVRKTSGQREDGHSLLDAATKGLGPGGDGGGGTSRSHALVRVHAALSATVQEQGPEAARLQLLQLESEGSELDACAYNLVIQALAKRSDMQGAEALLARLSQKGQPDEQSFLAVLSVACSKDMVSLSESLMRKMIETGVELSAASYAAVIQMHARSGNVRQGLTWLQHMKDAKIVPEPSIYNALIHACSLAGRSHEARCCFAAMQADGLKPSVMTFTALIDVCAKALDLKAAEAWMDEMRQLSIEPNVVSYSAMISACAKVGDLQRAEKWYGQMQERGVQPNAYSYSSLINACAKVGDVDAASAWLERAEKSGTAFDAVVYSCVINACARVGDAERAMTVFQKMRARDIPSNIIIYSALARPFAYRGDWAEVERIAEEMSAEGVAMNDYFLYTLILAYSRSKPREAGRAERAFVKAVKGGNIVLNDRLKKVLQQAVGYGRAMQLLQQAC